MQDKRSCIFSLLIDLLYEICYNTFIRKNMRKYSTTINDKLIEDDNAKSFTFACLDEIRVMNKETDPKKRLQFYIDYFIETYHYNFDEFNARTKEEDKEELTFAMKEDSLAKLFATNYGVCDQFAQAFSLLTASDEILYKNKLQAFYINYNITRDKEYAHAINIVNDKFIDLSSAIHAKENFYKEYRKEVSPYNFVLKTQDEYLDNLEEVGTTTKDTFFIDFAFPVKDIDGENVVDVDGFYRMLNSPAYIFNGEFNKDFEKTTEKQKKQYLNDINAMYDWDYQEFYKEMLHLLNSLEKQFQGCLFRIDINRNVVLNKD